MGVPRVVVSRRVATAVVLVLGLVGVLLGVGWLSGLALLVLGGLVATPEPRAKARWFTDLAAWLPVGAVVAVAASTLVVVLGAVTGQALWGDGRARVTLAVLLVAVASVAIWRRGRIALISPVSAVAWVPAALVGVVLGFRMLQPMSFWSRPAWAVTDWMNNAEMTIDLVKHGLLEHTSASQSAGGAPTVYPRGLHALLAWLVSSGPSGDAVPAAWEAVLAALFGAMAVLIVLALASAALLAAAVARRLGAPATIVVIATVVAPLLLLHPQAYSLLGPSGFLTTTAGVVLLYALMLVADAGPRRRGFAPRLVLALLAVLVAVHVWQLLALPVAVVVLVLGWHWWREGRPRTAPVATTAAVVALACLPLTWVTIGGGGTEQAGLDGSFEPLRAVTGVVVLVIAVAGLAIRRRAVGVLGTVLLAAIVTLVVLGGVLALVLGGRAGEVPYYAGKVLWHATVLALPVAVGASAYAVWRTYTSASLARAVGSRPLIRVLVVAAPLVVIGAYVGGGLSYGWWITVRGLPGSGGVSPQVPLVVLADEEVQDVEGRAALVFLLHPQGWHLWLRHEDWHASQVLRTLGATVPDALTLVGHRAAAACDFLRDHPDALRLTGPRHGDQELIRRGCPEEVVRPEAWRVLVTPEEWWQDTPWEATGGAPDPSLEPAEFLFEESGDRLLADIAE